jgi:hypothetical protein
LIILPVLDDWEALGLLLERLNAALEQHNMSADVLAVDDGSVAEARTHLRFPPLAAVGEMSVLHLRRNLGHQRAIAVALAYAEANLEYEAVVVMDSDGEDCPEHVPLLLAELAAAPRPAVVVGLRHKRSEGWLFRVFYAIYRTMFFLATGQNIRFGNFSAISWAMLPRLVALSELWNHYPAAILKSRVPYTALPLERGVRLAGRSRMNLVSLIVHGLSAVSVYSEVVGTRMMIASVATGAVGVVLAMAVALIRVATDWSIPGWATAAFGLSTVIVLQALGMAFVFAMSVLHARSAPGFLPMRDYSYYVWNRVTLPPALPALQVVPSDAAIT